MTTEHPDLVRTALSIKRVGNDLMAAIGGREIHPVSPRIGGFWAVPARETLLALRPRIAWALDRMPDVADFVASLDTPAFPRPAELVSMVNDDRYPVTHGRMASTAGRVWDASAYEDVTRELQVEHSNALHSVMADTGTPYFLGPLARVNLNAERLTPAAREVADRLGLRPPQPDPFTSMAARAVEITLALEESLAIVDAYVPPDPAYVQARPRAGRATWTTEAPRGTLYHRYDVAEDGTILAAKIVPPTSQNLRHMEADLGAFLPGVLDRPDDEVRRLCEMVVRNYDPCISCATHFLRLDLERR
jgi:coenzyme F420-reducing hydrogenase alpha subunit